MTDIQVMVQGETCTKLVYGQEQQVIPFVGVDLSLRPLIPSFGLYYPDGSQAIYLQHSGPNQLVRSWRAMRLLERLPFVAGDTLMACWAVMVERPDRSVVAPYIQELEAQLGGYGPYVGAWAKAVIAIPSAGELQAMLQAVVDLNVEVDVRELVLLVQSGKLPPNPLINELASRQNLAARRRMRPKQA